MPRARKGGLLRPRKCCRAPIGQAKEARGQPWQYMKGTTMPVLRAREKPILQAEKAMSFTRPLLSWPFLKLGPRRTDIRTSPGP